jgi:hypothetical protein
VMDVEAKACIYSLAIKMVFVTSAGSNKCIIVIAVLVLILSVKH